MIAPAPQGASGGLPAPGLLPEPGSLPPPGVLPPPGILPYPGSPPPPFSTFPGGSPGSQATAPNMSPQAKPPIVNYQPQPSLPMSVTGGGNRNSLGVPVLTDGLREWSYSLTDCLAEPSTCVLSTFLPCHIYSVNAQRFNHLERHGVPFHGHIETSNEDCIAYGILALFNAGWILQAMQRPNVRRRYGIRGDPLTDILISGCCVPCELVQEYREIQLEESSFIVPQ